MESGGCEDFVNEKILILMRSVIIESVKRA